MPEVVTNEFGQQVRVYEWEEFQQRLARRKALKKDTDLSGKTLVIKHTWGIGDILYTTPAVKALKEKFPTCEINYICSFPEILEGNPYVDKIHHWMQFSDFMEIGDDLNEDWYWLDFDVPLKGGFDYKINLRTKLSLNEHLLELLRKAPHELGGDERCFVDQASNTVISRYRMIALDMYCWHAFVDPPEKTIYYYPKEEELEFARRLLEPLKKEFSKVIVLIPHSSTVYKDYPAWEGVIRLLPKSYCWVVLGAGSSRRWMGPNVVNFVGAFRLRQSAALVIEADLCCSSDTGLLYTRAARGGKCIVTYGPHHWEPFLHYFPNARGLRVEKLTKTEGMVGMCSSACFIDTCACRRAGDPPPCLLELSPKLVAEEVQKCLE